MGHDSLDKVKAVVARYKELKFLLEGVWLDREYMQDYWNFKLSTDSNWTGLKEFAKNLHSTQQKLVLMVDAGFAANSSNPYFLSGLKDDVFIKSSTRNDTTIDG